MSKAKEKAKELVDKYNVFYLLTMRQAKQCALIAVENEYNAKIQAYNEMAEFCPDVASQAIIYAEREREEVKQEIINL